MTVISPLPTAQSIPKEKTTGATGQSGLNLRGTVPVAAKPATSMPIRPVPQRTAGGPTGSGVGAPKPIAGKQDIGAEFTKSWEQANNATQGDLDNAIGSLNKAEHDIGRQSNAERSALYQEAKAAVERSRQQAIEGAAQMGIALNPFMMEGVNYRSNAVAMAQYRRGAAEIRQNETQARMALAMQKASIYGSITRQGIDPGLAARIAEGTGAARAARDANGRLLTESERANKAYRDALKQLQEEQNAGRAGVNVGPVRPRKIAPASAATQPAPVGQSTQNPNDYAPQSKYRDTGMATPAVSPPGAAVVQSEVQSYINAAEGKAVLAALPENERIALIKTIERHPEMTLADLKVLIADFNRGR